MQMNNVERVRETIESLALAPASERLFRNATEVSEDISELKVGKAPGPNGVPNTTLTNLPWKALTFISKAFNGVLKGQHYPVVWKHARVISLLKPASIVL